MAKAAQNPDWTEDEHILALDVYLSKKPGQPQKSGPEVVALSKLLDRLHQKLGTQGRDTLRNADGVYMKLMNLKAHDPAFTAKGRKGLQRGNRLEKKVWLEYGHDLPRLKQVATAIQRFIESDMLVAGAQVAGDNDDELAPEGRLLVRVHRIYERKRENRLKKIAAFRKANEGRIFCEACGFNFETNYGLRGAGFIECHHQVALSSLKPNHTPKLSDLRLLCSNCHRMIHIRQPWLTVEELRSLTNSITWLQDSVLQSPPFSTKA